MVDAPNTINILTANHSAQQSLNELIYWMEFWNKGGRDFDKIIFMSNSFFCEDEEWFAKQIQEDNWFIRDANHNEHAKSVWSCKNNIFDELIINQLQYSAANHWSNFHSGNQFDYDSETFKFNLFFKELKLKPVPPNGMMKRGIQLPQNGHPIRIEMGCKKWLHGHY